MASKIKKAIKPIFWLNGNHYDKQKMWNRILNQIGTAKIKIFDSDLMTASEMVSHFSSQDMFSSDPQVYKIKGVPVDYEILNESLGLFRDDCILVVDSRVGYYNSAGNRFSSIANSNFYKQFKQYGKVLEYPTEYTNNNDLTKWCKSVLSDLGANIDDDALSLLIKYKGNNLDILYSELNKLSHVCLKEPISFTMIEQSCVPDDPGTVWLIIDELSRQRYNQSIEKTIQWLEHCGDTVSARYGEVHMFLSALAQFYLFILLCKDINDDLGFKKDEIISKISNFKKLNESGISPLFSSQYCGFQLSKMETLNLMQLSKSNIYFSYIAVVMTIINCRKNSNCSSYHELALTTLIAFLCRKVTLKHFIDMVNLKKQKGAYTWQKLSNL